MLTLSVAVLVLRGCGAKSAWHVTYCVCTGLRLLLSCAHGDALFKPLFRRRAGTSELTRTSPCWPQVLITEVLKLPLSIALLVYEKQSLSEACSTLKKEILGNPMDTLKIAIPALLYTVQNNALFVAMEHLEAAVFQVLPRLVFGGGANYARAISCTIHRGAWLEVFWGVLWTRRYLGVRRNAYDFFSNTLFVAMDHLEAAVFQVRTYCPVVCACCILRCSTASRLPGRLFIKETDSRGRTVAEG